jgi:hypothetical protein
MRRLVSGFWLIVLLASPFAGQTAEWQKYKNAHGNFTVLFPGEPNDSVNQTDDANIQSHTLSARQGTAIYMVVYATMAKAQLVDDANFEIFKNAVFHELPKCEVGSDQPASPIVQGFIGRRYRLNCDLPQTKKTIAGNLYWGKHSSYAVMAMFPADAAEPAEVKKFVDSFAVIDPDK